EQDLPSQQTKSIELTMGAQFAKHKPSKDDPAVPRADLKKIYEAILKGERLGAAADFAIAPGWDSRIMRARPRCKTAPLKPEAWARCAAPAQLIEPGAAARGVTGMASANKKARQIEQPQERSPEGHAEMVSAGHGAPWHEGALAPLRTAALAS
ncbi:unnamed protein product, partial [Prorocentrum cordatum]